MIKIIIAVAAAFGTWTALNEYTILHNELAGLGVSYLNVITLSVVCLTLSLGGK